MFRSTPSTGTTTGTMAISTSPRKTIPLSSGEDINRRPKVISLSSGPPITRRAFFCGVVVEGPNDGEDLPDAVQDLVASLGDRLPANFEGSTSRGATMPQRSGSGKSGDKQIKTDPNRLANKIEELVSTEETYVKRLRILKSLYADPLRSYARSKDTAIIPAYVANTMFGNIDQLVPAHESLLHDLQQMSSANGPATVGGVGDVALHHFKTLKAFDCYKHFYVKREEAQILFQREMSKKSSTGLAGFIERIRYSTNDGKNSVPLRELMIEPVQRIPRYTLLFREIMSLMAPTDRQRIKLAEADEIASRIALAETDDHTKLAVILNCLGAAIEGFPPDLIKSSRRFIDCIDVEDSFLDGMGLDTRGGINPYSSISSSSAASINSNASGGSALHCTLILFDDKLMIVRRPNNDKPGRVLAGLDDAERFSSGGFAMRAFMKKSGLSCKGVVDITDVVATDVSGADMHVYLESPPMDQSEKWSGRPLRRFSVVHPPYAINQDPMRTESDKRRFLENLWSAQARFRTKLGQSVALCGDDQEVDNRGSNVTIARTYFNIYQRTLFLKEVKKTKVVLHIDSLGTADPLPFGLNEPPYVVVRVHPMEGVSRYSVTSSDPEDEPEEAVVQTCEVPIKIVHTIQQYGLFKFRTNNPSRPATPASSRSRAHIFGLDVIPRNLFGALPGSKGDVFGGSIGSHRRSKSAISRSSTRTDTTATTSTMDSSMKFSSHSTSTAATSLSFGSSFGVDEDSFVERSATKSNKLVKRNRSRSRSPGATLGAESGDEVDNSSLKRHRSNSTSILDTFSYDYNDHGIDLREGRTISHSEMNLTKQLELARRNSQNQHKSEHSSRIVEAPVEDTIYEEEPPLPARPLSRASRSTYERDGTSIYSTTPPTTRSITPTPRSTSPTKGRSTSLHSADRRPLGPRPPSPLPPLSPSLPNMPMPTMVTDIALDLDATLAGLDARPRTPARYTDQEQSPTPSPLPRSKRQPFHPLNNTEATPKSSTAIEPLSIKKKVSTSSSTRTPVHTPSPRKPLSKESPLAKLSNKRQLESPPRKPSTQMDEESVAIQSRLTRLAETTKEDLECSHRALKRIRLELKSCPTNLNGPPTGNDMSRSPVRPTTPGVSSRTVASTNETKARFEEMRLMIAQRSGDAVALTKAKNALVDSSTSTSATDSSSDSQKQNWIQTIDGIASSAEKDILRAVKSCGIIEGDLKRIPFGGADSSVVEKCRTELRSTQRQCDLLKDLLKDSTAENEIMYQAFNEELDGMFNDANLPADDAWLAMTTDLRKAKEERNRLIRENAQLKRKMREMEMQQEDWAALLRQHKLIPS